MSEDAFETQHPAAQRHSAVLKPNRNPVMVFKHGPPVANFCDDSYTQQFENSIYLFFLKSVQFMTKNHEQRYCILEYSNLIENLLSNKNRNS